jgi:sortase (surface protein transpeptidase)
MPKVKLSVQKIRYVSAVATVYIMTIGIIGYALSPALLPSTTVYADTKKSEQLPHKPATPRFVVVSGKPVRVTIPDYGIDLPVDEGFYNPADGSWTLSETHAQFAMISVLANNFGGNTFVYGHGTDAVFGKIGTAPPPVGTVAKIYTDNNHVFVYTLKDVRNLTPNDTSVLDNVSVGPPTLTIQTCTGTFSEWRTMFRFGFERLEQ